MCATGENGGNIDTQMLVQTRRLLERAHTLEKDLIKVHALQLQMAGDVGYIKGAVELISGRMARMLGLTLGATGDGKRI